MAVFKFSELPALDKKLVSKQYLPNHLEFIHETSQVR